MADIFTTIFSMIILRPKEAKQFTKIKSFERKAGRQPANLLIETAKLVFSPTSVYCSYIEWKFIHNSLVIAEARIMSLDYFPKVKIRIN